MGTAAGSTAAFDKVAMITVFFLSIVSAIQLSTEYILRYKFSEQSMLQTHKLSYAFVVTLVLLSSLTYVHMLSIKKGETSYVSGSQRDEIIAQFWVAFSAVIAGPILQQFKEKDTNATVVPKRQEVEMTRRPASGSAGEGLRADKLLARPKAQAIELQFV